MPDLEWLKNEKPEFDFFTFDEAKRLIAAAESKCHTMIVVALRTILMTMRYAHLAPEVARETVQLLPSWLGRVWAEQRRK